MKNLPVAILALLGFSILFWPDSTAPMPTPEPEPTPVVAGDLLDEADEAYRQEFARLVGKYSAGDWTAETKRQWADDVLGARAKTHKVVADRVAQAFAEGSAATLVESIRNGDFK